MKNNNIINTIVLLSLFAVLAFSSSITPVYAWSSGGWGGDSGCCDSGGNWGSGIGDDYGDDDIWGGNSTPSTPAPTCSISATPSTVNYDGTTTLKWTTTNATGASINGVGYVQVGSNKTMSMPHMKNTTTYTMTVTGAGGTSTCKTTVTVRPRPSCSLSVNPSSVEKGGNATLSWTSSHASTASISGIGTVGLNGSYTVSNLQNTKTYTMTVRGNGQTAKCSAKITVTNPPVPAPSCNISASPSSITRGDNTTLTWSSSNATSARINGLGSVATNGSRTISNLQSDRTFTMTVKNSANVSRTCSVTVHVNNPPVPAPSCDISISPSRVDYGDDATIVWSTSNAVSARISDIGSVSLAGSRTIYNVRHSKTYTMTVKNSANVSRTCSARVRVRENNLSCSIYASPNPNNDGSTTLHWSSDNAVWAIINNGVGSVSVDGQKTITGLSNGTQVYTLTVGDRHSGGRTRTCSVTVRTNKTTTPTPVTYPTCTITASRTYIKQGEGTTLYWSSQNANSAIFTNNGAVSTTGSKVVYPNSSAYYKLIVTDSQGHQSSCQTYITVSQPTNSVVVVSSVPYTGPNDGIYTGLMLTIFTGSMAFIYKRRRQVMELLNI